VKESQLPELVAPTTVVGKISPEVSRLTGLPGGLPVVAGASDGGLANLGSGAVNPGEMVITVGTSGAVRRMVAQPWLDPLARTWCYVLLEDRWFCGGAINSAGLAVQWVREKFYPELTPEAGMQRLMGDAGKINTGSDGLFFLPYFAGERSPHWNPALRASLHGLSLEHQRGHVARAVLEGVAYCLRDVWVVLTQDQAQVALARLTGGITQSPVWTQIVTDVIGVPVLPVEAADASAIGAGMLGAYGLGLVDSLGFSSGNSASRPMIYPDQTRHALYLALHENFRDIFHRINESA
jgi:gluconokinase